MKFGELPRMADFATWAASAMPALQKKPGGFIHACRGNRADANTLTLEASKIAKYIQAIAAESPWRGAATMLLAKVNAMATEEEKRQRGWPRDARGLSSALRKISANLTVAGTYVTFDKSRTVGRAIIIDKVIAAA